MVMARVLIVEVLKCCRTHVCFLGLVALLIVTVTVTGELRPFVRVCFLSLIALLIVAVTVTVTVTVTGELQPFVRAMAASIEIP